MLALLTQAISVIGDHISAILAGATPGTITNSELNCTRKLKTPRGASYYHVSNSVRVAAEGAVFSVTVEAIRPNHRHETVVVTDGWYDTLSPLTKIFIMSHEQAHIDNGDFHPGLISGVRSNGLRIEYLADEVAANHVGRSQAIRSLHEVREVISSPLFICAKARRSAMLDELDKRIRHLEQE